MSSAPPPDDPTEIAETSGPSLKVVTNQPGKLNDDNKSDMYDTQMFKFKNPADECAPEDCCCCFYFLYLLFDDDNKPHEVLPKKILKMEAGPATAGPGYSYYSNMSTGSSIDSKNSWFGRYPPSNDDNNDKEFSSDKIADEDEADGWKATNVPSGKDEPSNSQDMINLHDYSHQDFASNAGPSSDGHVGAFIGDGSD